MIVVLKVMFYGLKVVGGGVFIVLRGMFVVKVEFVIIVSVVVNKVIFFILIFIDSFCLVGFWKFFGVMICV